MVKTVHSLTLSQNFKSRHSLIHALNFSLILLSPVITRINFGRCYHDLSETCFTASNILGDSVFKVNLNNNQEVGCLASEPFQLKLPTVNKGIFQQ